MFTGIVKDIGIVQNVVKMGSVYDLTVNSPLICKDLAVDDSVSVNGCCQTVVALDGNNFRCNVVESTLRKTNLSSLNKFDYINLETALKFNGGIDGHFVQGHVNSCGKVKSILNIKNFYILEISYDHQLYADYVTNEGSITVDGVSLTISDVNDHLKTISVYIIPHTWEKTIFKFKKIGDLVNLEFDIFAHYANRIYKNSKKNEMKESVIYNFLKNN